MNKLTTLKTKALKSIDPIKMLFGVIVFLVATATVLAVNIVNGTLAILAK